MSLSTYKHKRDFHKTPEPSGAYLQAHVDGLTFVVQKHEASQLHYDFRLELGGVLKSWAIPKGPSMNPSDRRLAMMVEDHPIDYRLFEGIIPPGNYGAGTVMIWDSGTYEAKDISDWSSEEATLKERLEQGVLDIVMHGKKLKGAFTLRRFPTAGNKAWLLIKRRDAFAVEEDGTPDNASVPGLKATAKRRAKPMSIRREKKSPMPSGIKPMLPTLVDEPFDREGWLFEVTWAGQRVIAEVKRNKVELYSGERRLVTRDYAGIADEVTRVNHNAILDGEIVTGDDTKHDALSYIVFDILYIDGEDVRRRPLHERKALLLAALPHDLQHVRVHEYSEVSGKALFAIAKKHRAAGIVGKNTRSAYMAGKKSKEWLEIKV